MATTARTTRIQDTDVFCKLICISRTVSQRFVDSRSAHSTRRKTADSDGGLAAPSVNVAQTPNGVDWTATGAVALDMREKNAGPVVWS
jgi:hypothetical protein